MLLDMSREDMKMMGLEHAGWCFIVRRQVLRIAEALLEACEDAGHAVQAAHAQ